MTRWVAVVALAVAASALVRADGPKEDLTPEQRKELEAKATALNEEGGKLYEAVKLHEAAQRLEDALELRRKLYPEDKYPGGHPQLANSLNSLAYVLANQGRLAAAEPLFREALAMTRRLYPEDKYPGGHPDLAQSLNGLAFVLRLQGHLAAAEPLYREALAMYRALTEEYAKTRSDGDALTLLGSFPLARDAYLSLRLDRPDAAGHLYVAVWPSRAAISRVLERKHLAARAAATAPQVRGLWDELNSLRRQRADLILAAMPRDPTTARPATDSWGSGPRGSPSWTGTCGPGSPASTGPTPSTGPPRPTSRPPCRPAPPSSTCSATPGSPTTRPNLANPARRAPTATSRSWSPSSRSPASNSGRRSRSKRP
jgi:tetratricopeptide (TPR) repeat protein